MMFNDFRGFLAFLEDRGELKRVRRPVDRYLETALVTKKAIEAKGPALLFENVKGYGIPIASGVYGTRKRVCLGLNTTPESFVRDYVGRSEKLRDFSPRVVSSGPCKENTIKGKKVDLNKLLGMRSATGAGILTRPAAS
jgi:4-hydroxy-3-polyprenylbenzoate decarboxylase